MKTMFGLFLYRDGFVVEMPSFFYERIMNAEGQGEFYLQE